MRRIRKVQLWVFLLVSILDVRVRAARPLDEPKNCLHLAGRSCALHARHEMEKFRSEHGEIRVLPGATVLRMSEGEYRIVRGLVHVHASRSFSSGGEGAGAAKASGAATAAGLRIHTLYGDLTVRGGDVLINAQDTRVQFTNLSADALKYSPRGDSQNYDLPVGYSTYLSRVASNGIAEVGFPKPALITELLKEWSRAYTPSEITLFKEKVQSFQPQWRMATESVGAWYSAVALRMISEEKADDARRARLKAMQEAEDKRFRDMLRERIFFE